MSAPLLQGAVHLLVADDALAEGHRHGTYIAACGEVVCASSLPTVCCPPDCERDHLYCPACVRAAVRWNAGMMGDGASGAVDQMATR